MSDYLYRCEACPGGPPPEESAQWQIKRHGDVVTTWACDAHFVKAVRRLAKSRPDLKVYTVTRLRESPIIQDKPECPDCRWNREKYEALNRKYQRLLEKVARFIGEEGAKDS